MNLTDDEIENWAGGRPRNPTTEQGVRMALEIRNLRKLVAERDRQLANVNASLAHALRERNRLEDDRDGVASLPITADPGTLTLTDDPRCSHVHLRGVFGDGGENEGVLSVGAVLDASPNYPESGLIDVGSPQASPLIPGYLPKLGFFSCGVAGAERLIRALQTAVQDVKAGLAASEQPARISP